MEQRTKVTHDEHIDADYAAAQGAVDEGAVDDQVYVPQPVAQDRHTERERNEKHKAVHARVGDEISKDVALTRWRDDLWERHQREETEQGRRNAEDYPLRLLALGWVGDMPVTVNMHTDETCRPGEQ